MSQDLIELKRNVAKNIQLYRLNMGLTQEALGNKLGVSVHTVAGYEIANRLPPYPTIIKMSEVFGKSIESILGIEPPASTENSLEEDTLLEYFRNATPIARRFIIESAKTFSQLGPSEIDNPSSYISRKRGEYTVNR